MFHMFYENSQSTKNKNIYFGYCGNNERKETKENLH